MRTVIMINSNAKKDSSKKQMKDYRKELREIISQVDAAKNRLAEICVEMDKDDLETAGIDEALDALDDAVDMLEDALEEE